MPPSSGHLQMLKEIPVRVETVLFKAFVYLFSSGKFNNWREGTCAQLCIILSSIFVFGRENAQTPGKKRKNPCVERLLWYIFTMSCKTVFFKKQNAKLETFPIPCWSVCLLCVLRSTRLLKLAAVLWVESDTWGRVGAVPARHHVWQIYKRKEVQIAT